MTELENRLDKLTLRLDHMSMRVEQAVIDALEAVEEGDIAAGQAVNERDSVIDREEVEIEQECIRLLALYQPAAVDLRRVCTIIKVNNDLERIADLATAIGRRVKHVVAAGLDLRQHAELGALKRDVLDIVGRTARILNTTDLDGARGVIEFDKRVDMTYRQLVQTALSAKPGQSPDFEPTWNLITLAKTMERMGDLCTNIAEDLIFLRTGEIVRHGGAFGERHSQ
jgi:phosphate transport system protein